MDNREMQGFYAGRLVLVTGATGFIGRRLVAALRKRGAWVRVLVRVGSAMPADWHELDIITGDLMDAASLARACVGVASVVHAAGFAHVEAGNGVDFAARHWAVNAEGTFRLLEAAARAGVGQFVFLSSVKAVGDPGPRCVDESWDAPPETPYGQAKRAAEERVLATGREYGMRAVNMRPALVYGPGMKANLARLLKAARRGWLPPLPETGNRRSLVHVDDMAQAALLAIAHPRAAGKSYFVTDGRPYSGRELYLIMRQALGRSAPRWAIPASALHGLAGLVDGTLALVGQRRRPAGSALDKLLGWACYDSSRLTRELGYRPTWTLDLALPELVHELE